MSDQRKIISASDAGISFQSFHDIADSISDWIGAPGMILTENDLAKEFFDLRSGLLGELLQKFINYKLRVALVVSDPEIYGERFSELAFEHRSHPMIRFVPSVDEAKAWLSASSQ
jgi:hypothetical protein